MYITETFMASSRSAWRDWLAAHHKSKSEIWLILDRHPDVPCVSYLDAVEESICFGWIDGIAKKYSESATVQRLTPRRKRSNWTELNKARARRLIRLGLMTPAGSETLPDLTIHFSIPNDVAAALKAEPGAWKNFLASPPLYQRIRVGYLEDARKQPAEFEKRLSSLVAKTAAGKMIGNWTDGGRLDAS